MSTRFATALRLRTLPGLSEIPVPSDAGVGLTQSLAPSGGGEIARTVNGDAVFIGNPQFQQYETTISGRMFAPPAFAALWPGDLVQVECIAVMRQRVPANGVVRIARPAVSGTVVARTLTGAVIEHTGAGRDFVAPGARYIEWRPILDCMVSAPPSWDAAETDVASSWSLSLVERALPEA